MIPLARRYRLLSVVGQGGMGTVWRAHDETLDRDVAVKEVRLPERLTRGERRLLCRRLIDEARSTAALRHPGVVEVYDILTDDGRPWIVMEFLQARSLHDVINQDGRLPPEDVARIGASVLSVLGAAHDQGILHRDVKPSNVLMCEDGRVVLTDFGLAVHMHEHNESRQEPEETLVAGIEGSPAYLPPERVRGEPGVQASDLWSLGATLYAAVEGDSPFLRSHALASMVAVLLGEYDPPVHAGPLTPVIEGLLRQDPAHRLSAGYIAELLEDAYDPRVPADRAWRRLLPSKLVPTGVGGAGALVRGRVPRAGLVAGIACLAVTAMVSGAWTSRGHSTGRGDALALRPASGSETGTVTYYEPVGYAIDVPAGWRREARAGGGVQWNAPLPGQGLRITPLVDGPPRDVADGWPRDAVDGWPRDTVDGSSRDAGGAFEWEYPPGAAGASTHVLRGRIGGYEFSCFAPGDRWDEAHHRFERIMATFREM